MRAPPVADLPMPTLRPPLRRHLPSARRTATLRSASLLALLCTLVLVPLIAAAWGQRGHALVGALAERELSPAAAAEVARLLAGEPEPSLAGVADWADTLRENDPDLGRRSAKWHYVNMAEDGCAARPATQCPGGDCLYAAIATQRAILSDRARPLAERRQALKFLVHFVGDAHQPLHAGFARDRGGNTHQIRHAGEGSNLHRLWDRELPARAGMSRRAQLDAIAALPLPADADIADPMRWAAAACKVALRPGFYPKAGSEVGEAYLSRWRPVADAQLRLAGHRLGRLLEAALGEARRGRGEAQAAATGASARNPARTPARSPDRTPARNAAP